MPLPRHANVKLAYITESWQAPPTPASSRAALKQVTGGWKASSAGMDAVKAVLRSLRSSQPLNYLTTSLAFGALTITGLRAECFVKHLHRIGTVRRRLPNGRILSLWSRGDDWVSNQIYWKGWDGYEPEMAPLFFSLATRAMVTIDVGAYVGYYTLIAAHANPAGRVYAFEPLPTIHQRLLRNVALNGPENVECVASAVGEVDGEADFFHVAT